MDSLFLKIDEIGYTTKNKWLAGACQGLAELWFSHSLKHSLNLAKSIWFPKKKKCKCKKK